MELEKFHTRKSDFNHFKYNIILYTYFKVSYMKEKLFRFLQHLNIH